MNTPAAAAVHAGALAPLEKTRGLRDDAADEGMHSRFSPVNASSRNSAHFSRVRGLARATPPSAADVLMADGFLQKQERRAGWPGSFLVHASVGSNCFVLSPRIFFRNPTSSKTRLSSNSTSKLQNAQDGGPRGHRLHYQRKAFQLFLQYGQGAARHFYTADGVPSRLR